MICKDLPSTDNIFLEKFLNNISYVGHIHLREGGWRERGRRRGGREREGGIDGKSEFHCTGIYNAYAFKHKCTWS